MEFSFQQILDQMNQGTPESNFAWSVARSIAVPTDYVFNSILPNVEQPTFDVKGGTLTFTPTMLQGVPMDDHFPPFGAISSSNFFENTTKIAGSMFFNEKQLRDLYEWEMSIRMRVAQFGGSVAGDITVDPGTGRANDNTINGRRVNSILGMTMMMMQAHWDTQEYLKGKALCYGAINGNDFKFMGTKLDVDYGVPAANKFAARAGSSAYGGSASTFWTDMRNVLKILSAPQVYMNSTTYYSIIDQAFNNIRVDSETMLNRYLGVKRILRDNLSQARPYTDSRDKMSINVYDRSGSVLKVTGTTPTLQALPFLPDGKIFIVGDLEPFGYQLTQGAVRDPNNDMDFGYNHIAPTVEGGMIPGIWSRIFTPEAKPMQLMAETAVNELPVIINPKKLVILTTEV